MRNKDHFYGYGIIDNLGHPYWSDSCVCQDREPIDDICSNLNNYPDREESKGRTPFRVVVLRWERA